jgi:hypothetical protein
MRRRPTPLSFLTPGDLVEYKTDFRAPWRTGFVHSLTAHTVTIQDGDRRVTIEPGTRGKVHKPGGRELDQPRLFSIVLGALRAKHKADPAAVRIVRTTADLVEVPKDPSPYRSEEYRQHVRRHRCCNPLCPDRRSPIEAHHVGPHAIGDKAPDTCCVPLSVVCHVAVTRTYCLPGHSRGETDRLFARVQVQLLTAYLLRLEEQAPRVPLLRLVAGEVPHAA